MPLVALPSLAFGFLMVTGGKPCRRCHINQGVEREQIKFARIRVGNSRLCPPNNPAAVACVSPSVLNRFCNAIINSERTRILAACCGGNPRCIPDAVKSFLAHFCASINSLNRLRYQPNIALACLLRLLLEAIRHARRHLPTRPDSPKRSSLVPEMRISFLPPPIVRGFQSSGSSPW